MKLLFLGDFFYRQEEKIKSNLSDHIDQDCAIFANFEGCITSKCVFESGKVLLGQSKRSVFAANELSIKYVSLANNHLHDHDNAAIALTYKLIQESGIIPFGLIRSNSQEDISVNLRIDEDDVIIFAITHKMTGAVVNVANEWNFICGNIESPKFLSALEESRSKGKFVIVYVHWGETNYRFPSWDIRQLARKLVSSGANLIVGHHPHVTQGMELIDGARVYYSLGNLVFDEYEGRKGRLKLPQANRRSMGVLLEPKTKEISILRFLYDPNEPKLNVVSSPRFELFLLSFPFKLPGLCYRIYLRIYFLYRLVTRLLYWLAPTRVRQAGPRQIQALKLLIKKIFA